LFYFAENLNERILQDILRTNVRRTVAPTYREQHRRKVRYQQALIPRVIFETALYDVVFTHIKMATFILGAKWQFEIYGKWSTPR
jgi:hypothetical protein